MTDEGRQCREAFGLPPVNRGLYVALKRSKCPVRGDTMQTEEITIRADADAARAYRAASEQEKRKFDLLLSLRLHDALRASGSLPDSMADLSPKDHHPGIRPIRGPSLARPANSVKRSL